MVLHLLGHATTLQYTNDKYEGIAIQYSSGIPCWFVHHTCNNHIYDLFMTNMGSRSINPSLPSLASECPIALHAHTDQAEDFAIHLQSGLEMAGNRVR